MKGFYQITTAIKDQLYKDVFVNTVSSGDIFEIDLNKQTIFPLSHIIVNNVITEEQYLGLLKDQQFIEKSFKLQEVKKGLDGESGGKPTKGVNPKQTKASKADTQEKEMTNVTQETIEKAQYDAKEVELQKALADIQKAKEEIELFKAKEKEAVEKAREAEVIAAVVDVDASAKLFKAVKDLDAEAFKDVVDVVKALTAKVDESEMFKEKGSPEEGVKVAKSAVQAELDKLLKKA